MIGLQSLLLATVSFLCQLLLFILLVLVGRKWGLLCQSPKGPWILGIEDTWSIAYPNVAIFRRDRDETVRDLVDRVAGVIVK